jgi:putative endonuclease
MSHDTKHLGQWGEATAEKYLIDRGYKILDRNYRTTIGELDIVARKNDVIAFVEVKTRDSINADHFLPEESVNSRKQSKLKKLGEIYLTKHKYKDDQGWQIDVISVILNKSTQEVTINHIQNAVYG